MTNSNQLTLHVTSHHAPKIFVNNTNKMPNNQLEYKEVQKCEEDEIREELNECLSQIRYGDLYAVGRIWIEAVRSGLVGSRWSLIPTVEAAKPPPPPEKPPPMRYKDLPLYKSPHYEYKDYIEDKDKCPKAKVKLAQECLYPYVSYFRRSLQASCCEFTCELNNFKKEIGCALNKKKNNFKQYMRCPDNLLLRQGVIALGGAAGFYVGSAKGIPTKVFCTGLGIIAAGALCFPKETDEAFRNFTYHSGKTFLAVYNFYCNKFYQMRERIPCPEDMPPPPKYRKPNVCPQKK